jgi:chitodextrinase
VHQHLPAVSPQSPAGPDPASTCLASADVQDAKEKQLKGETETVIPETEGWVGVSGLHSRGCVNCTAGAGSWQAQECICSSCSTCIDTLL